MDKEYNKYYNKIIASFKTSYETTIKAISPEEHREISFYIPSLFRRWYYSAFIDESLTSPANLIHNLNLKFDENEDCFPHIRYSFNDLENPVFYIEKTDYDIENHPIFDDALTLLKRCSPIISLNELLETKDESLFDDLTVRDIGYVNYLISILINLGLLKKAPSINTFTYRPAKDAEKFFDDDKFEMLEKIVNATVSVFIGELADFLPVNEQFKKTMCDLVLKAQDTENIFDKLFSMLGLDMADVFNIDTSSIESGFDNVDFDINEADESDLMKHALVTGTFFIGVALDKHFLTPFSYYLQLFRPLYTLAFNMEEEMQMILEFKGDGEDSPMSLYSPCSFYSLTALGKKYSEKIKRTVKARVFKVKKFGDAPEFDMSEPISSSKTELLRLIDMVLSLASADKFEQNLFESPFASFDPDAPNILEVKIKIARDKRFWQSYFIPDTTSLDNFHKFISESFGFISDNVYYFTLPNSKGKTKIGGELTLKQLNLSNGFKFSYSLCDTVENYTGKADLNNPVTDFEIEVVYVVPDFIGNLDFKFLKASKLYNNALKKD